LQESSKDAITNASNNARGWVNDANHNFQGNVQAVGNAVGNAQPKGNINIASPNNNNG